MERISLSDAARIAGLKEHIDFGRDVNTGRFWIQESLIPEVQKVFEGILSRK